jgi:MYXO-CTERM domain-containing protein
VDSAVTVTWMLGDRFSAPLASGPAWTAPGDLLCQATASLQVTARATGDRGVFAEAGAAVEVVTRPSLRLLGEPPDRLALPPGGAAGTAESAAWPACLRSAAFTWGQQQLPGLVEGPLVETATTSRRAFTVPEGAYPDLLAGAPALTVSATDDLGATGQAVLPLRLDAEGLVEAAVTVDRSALARGEVTVATARLRSRLGVPLPSVRAAFRIAGLVVAGPVSAEGTTLSPGAAGGEAVVDLLPAAGGEVRLSVPLRGVGQPGEVAVELFSSGGHRLTPAAGAAAGPDRLPGCGCGAGGGPAGVALAGLALLGLRAPRRRGRAPPAT